MGRIKILASELATDPKSLGYAGMSNAEVATVMNSPIQSRDKTSLTTQEVLGAMEASALLTLPNDQATRVWGVLGMDSIDPFGVAVDVFIEAFGPTSATITDLKALRVQAISRAQELGYQGVVKEGHVEQAKGNTDDSIKVAGTNTKPEPLVVHEVTS